ncbi:MAG: deoxyribodipyrimidine photo-lyase [Caulobacteraceae bacterium]|nr:deoxyribodipyrimidine photo-lyase [Caulobacteraceae bacterium]
MIAQAAAGVAAGGVALVWFRQDLRLADNPALVAAVASGLPVVPAFVLAEGDGSRPWGGASRWWLDKSLRSLGASLGDLGSRLVLRRGDPTLQILSLARQVGAAKVFWNRIYDAPGIARDTALKSALREDGIEVQSFNAGLLDEPWTVKTGVGGDFKVFTPYWRAARALLKGVKPQAAPNALVSPVAWPESEDLDAWGLHPRAPDWSGGFEAWRPGEGGAETRVDHFLETGLDGYGVRRDLPGGEAFSRLSPHLHWGEIGPRQVWRQSHAYVENRPDLASDLGKFLSELGWREFNHHLLFHNPTLPTENFRRNFDRFPWRNDPAGLEAWRRGRTGYPIVDAGMRELWATGFMHNRVRMVVASFLIKHLLIDWREGEAWFWDTLLDADLANNVANWQWSAGCGADAAPFFRIFNPVTQGEKFDGEGVYVRRWVPELARLPNAVLHSPWMASEPVLDRAGVRLGLDYPRPIVDHAMARQQALEAFKGLKVLD